MITMIYLLTTSHLLVLQTWMFDYKSFLPVFWKIINTVGALKWHLTAIEMWIT